MVITNNDIINSIDYLAPLGKSDHSVLIITTVLSNSTIDCRPTLNYNKGQYDELREFMNCDWDSLLKPCMENVELMWNTIKTKTLEGIEKYIPVVLPFLGSTP